MKTDIIEIASTKKSNDIFTLNGSIINVKIIMIKPNIKIGPKNNLPNIIKDVGIEGSSCFSTFKLLSLSLISKIRCGTNVINTKIGKITTIRKIKVINNLSSVMI